MSDTVIVRRRVESNFTTLPNELIRDNRLTWKAMGLLVYLLSLPATFRLNLVYLAKQRPSGRDATRSALRELEVAGYVSIERNHDSRGRFSTTTWMVSQTPDYMGESPCSENPQTVKPKLGSPEAGKPTLTSTDTEQRIKEERTTTKMALHETFECPAGLSADVWAAIEKALVALPPEDAKALLEELKLAMRAGAIKTTPLRWFFGLKKRYEAGQFVSTSRSMNAPKHLGGDSKVPAPLKALSREMVGQHLKELKAQISGARPAQ